MTRKMNPSLQERMLSQMMSNTRWGNGEVDVHAHMDRSLRLDENMANIRSQFGIQTRNRGMEHIHQQSDERKREQVRRQDTTRQSGPIQGALGHHMDALLHALPPGRRVSASGNVYYERRENRSDKNYHQRL